ncbi:MAG: hypothetical protein IAF38_20525 [Bacteroidia bacterium]|nr:hypothetical protein [Bacteroidia bacterium]
MKKLIASFSLCLMTIALLKAQTFPYGINYQAVARDANGNAKTNQAVNVRFSINKTTATGTLIWQETNATATTNSMGQFNLVIGAGTTTGLGSAASFSAINWLADVHWLTVDIFNGSVYVPVASQQFQSVPYALVSKKSDTANVAKFSQWSDYAVYEERYVSGTSVASVSGWNQRLLNNTQASNGTAISRSGSTITLNPGTYYIKAQAQAYRCNDSKLCVKDISNNIVLNGIADIAHNSYGVTTKAMVEGVIVVTVQTSYKLDHFASTAYASGLGQNLTLPSIDEVYATVFIQKIK